MAMYVYYSIAYVYLLKSGMKNIFPGGPEIQGIAEGRFRYPGPGSESRAIQGARQAELWDNGNKSGVGETLFHPNGPCIETETTDNKRTWQSGL